MIDLGFGYASPAGDETLAPLGDKIIAIMGQSNAVGTGDVADLTVVTGYATPYANVIQKQKIANTPTEPLTWTEFSTEALAPRPTVPNMGVELSLGRYLDRIAAGNYSIVKLAISGSALELHWKPSANYPVAPPTLFDQAVAYLQDAESDLAGYIAAIVWVQGEHDAMVQAHAEAYEANLTAFVNGMRAHFPYAAFVFNRLHVSADPAFTATVRAQQTSFAAAVPNVSMVNCDDIALLPDNLHFTDDAHVPLGQRLALAVAERLALNVPPAADFTFSATGLDVDFTDASTDDDGTVVAWHWDFDDGTESTVQNPSHTFPSNATFNVTLTVTDSDGGRTQVTKVVNLNLWTVDATSGKAIPQDVAEMTAFIAAVNATLTGMGHATVPAPFVGLTCQDAAGDPVDFISGLTFAASGTGLAYQGAVAGWSSKALVSSDGGTGAFRCTDASLPSIALGAITAFGWILRSAAGSLARSVMTMGATTINHCGGQAVLRCQSGANAATGAVNTQGAVHMLCMLSDKPGGKVGAYDSDNRVLPTVSTLITGKGLGLGGVGGIVNSATARYLYFFAFNVALTETQIKVIMETAGETVNWTPV